MEVTLRSDAAADSVSFPVDGEQDSQILSSALATAVHLQNLTGLFPRPSGSSSAVRAYVHDYEWPGVSASHSVPRLAAASVKAVLRTPSVWSDRVTARVAYMAFDEYGSPAVSTPSSVQLLVSLPGSGTLDVGCSRGSIGTSARRYLDYCSADIPASWFGAGGGDASVELRMTPASGQPAVALLLGNLAVVAPPSWYARLFLSKQTTYSHYMSLYI